MELDEDLGEDYTTQYRMYDAGLGRWFSPDPLVYDDETPYSFCGNNPVNYTDRDGLEKKLPKMGKGGNGLKIPGAKAGGGGGFWNSVGNVFQNIGDKLGKLSSKIVDFLKSMPKEKRRFRTKPLPRDYILNRWKKTGLDNKNRYNTRNGIDPWEERGVVIYGEDGYDNPTGITEEFAKKGNPTKTTVLDISDISPDLDDQAPKSWEAKERTKTEKEKYGDGPYPVGEPKLVIVTSPDGKKDTIVTQKNTYGNEDKGGWRREATEEEKKTMKVKEFYVEKK